MRAGLLQPVRPDRLLGMALALVRWGVSPATGYAAGAARHPDRLAVVDDQGSLSYREVHERTDRIAGELRAAGIEPGDAVGLLARNGRGFIEGLVALSKCGADVICLNTGAGPEQIAEVVEAQSITALIHDEDLAGRVTKAARGRPSFTTEQLDELAESSDRRAPAKSGHKSRLVILTSGTTGTPRGAARSDASIDDAISMLSRIPLRAGEKTVIASPLFHAWGLGQWAVAMLLGSTIVVQRRFDPARVLEAIEEHQATGLVVVPVMLDRLLEADSQADTSSLKVIASSGSALPGELATRVLERFGPVLYNLYGSTEVAYVAVATPEELAKDPRTAGKPPWGVKLRIVDEKGHDCPAGVDGRIFAGSGLSFDGYTDGSDKDRLDGLVATGDRGVLGSDGLLTVLGRDDDMVVIGGENVFTTQVEDALRAHPSVRDAAITTADDPKLGVRLIAHVVGEAKAEDLEQHVQSRLARFAVPKEFRFVEELPRNATGKVVKRDLA